mgnify:CR=1 FL=1
MDYGPILSPDGVQYRWNSHSISAAERCLRYYNWTVLEGWRSRNESAHLTFGSHYAAGLQHFFLLRAAGADREQAIHEVVKATLIATAGWESDHVKNRFTLIRTLVWYFDEFNDDLPVLHSPEGTPAVEHRFTLDLDDGNMLVGTLDRVVLYAGAEWIMDQKTTGSSLGPHYFDQYKPHMQMSAYTFAGRAVFGQPIQGVIIDAAEIKVGFSRFARGLTYRTDSELQEWYEGAMWWIEAAQRATREHYFPPNTSSCTAYGGCPFRRVCSSSPESRPNFLRADFVQSAPAQTDA